LTADVVGLPRGQLALAILLTALDYVCQTSITDETCDPCTVLQNPAIAHELAQQSSLRFLPMALHCPLLLP
jgi:hypothetical protein